MLARFFGNARRRSTGLQPVASPPPSQRVANPFYIIAALCLVAAPAAHADDPIAFLGNYCMECHDEDVQKGDRRFDQLSLPIKDEHGIILLQDIIDQLNLGEMPPQKADQPSAEEKTAAIAALTKAAQEARASVKSTGGQTVLRRLNRREYRNTVADLFHLDLTAFDPTSKFPSDRPSEHMDNIGASLVTSGYLLDQYLEAADAIVEKALGQFEPTKPRNWHFTDNFQQGAELKFSHKSVYDFEYLCLYEVPNTTRHEGGYAYLHELRDGVPADGFYEIKALAHTMHRDHPYDPKIFGLDGKQPFRMGIVPGDIKAGILHHPQPIEPQLAEVTVPDSDQPQWRTMRVWLNKGQTPRFIFPNGMADCRGAFAKIARDYKSHWPKKEHKDLGIFQARRVVLKYGKMPHIRIHEVKVRGPIYEQWPPKAQTEFFGADGFEAKNTRDILKRFADRAYRRPATKTEIDQLMSVVKARRNASQTPRQAVKDAIKAALCSPAFLYLAEPGRDAGLETLRPHDLASRLSYFLWSTMPDAELRARADDGTLTKPQILSAQLARLLADPRSDRFIAGFLDSWLNLRALGDMPPDRGMFRSYYAKDLETAMRRETQQFTRHLITENRPVTDYLSADYTFANQALAEHYKLDATFKPATAHRLKKVSLPDQRRGGLLGMASVLTVTANGIETSPVNRGVWLLENILGTPPSPPPDDVPAIDPDVRGTKTVRDQLTKHRDNPTCFECHRRIDPPGFALENFDPIGAWRTHYPLGRRKGPKIDASAELSSGEKFKDVIGYKKLLLEREDQFLRTLTTRLLTYATGRHIEPLDRPQIDRIVEEVKKEGKGMRTLIESCVASPIFQAP